MVYNLIKYDKEELTINIGDYTVLTLPIKDRCRVPKGRSYYTYIQHLINIIGLQSQYH